MTGSNTPQYKHQNVSAENQPAILAPEQIPSGYVQNESGLLVKKNTVGHVVTRVAKHQDQYDSDKREYDRRNNERAYDRIRVELASEHQKFADRLNNDINRHRNSADWIPVPSLEETERAFRSKFEEWAENGSIDFYHNRDSYGGGDYDFHLFLSPNTVLSYEELMRFGLNLNEGNKNKTDQIWEDYTQWTPEELCPIRPGGLPINFSLVSNEPTMFQNEGEIQKEFITILQRRFPSLVIPGEGDTMFRNLSLMESGALDKWILKPGVLGEDEMRREVDTLELTQVYRFDLKPKESVGYKGRIEKCVPHTFYNEGMYVYASSGTAPLRLVLG